MLVWLHGGGFAAGSSIEHIAYEGENMSKYGDVVVVSLNHRLNILGYLDLSPFGEKYKNSGEINFKLDRKQEAMDAVRDWFMSQEQATASMDFDGYRVEFPQWWFNIRPSNTEPYLRFLCEATTQELLDEKVAKVREIIAKYA